MKSRGPKLISETQRAGSQLSNTEPPSLPPAPGFARMNNSRYRPTKVEKALGSLIFGRPPRNTMLSGGLSSQINVN
ncbi:hypothetical protein EYF80_051131 [Liparis tanakae]|uniref:Uncharacterized protein n=1 Tax=Liparis tanakae TaxID=230148 RepID=A0A4Z2FCQ1_9TELE|nr:hypothetical protein EYF80_051131 [Liparis tanakae]